MNSFGATPGRAVAPGTGLLVGCFGRLPMEEDYIRHNVSAPEIVRLERALEAGLALWAARPGVQWKDVVDRLDATHFVRYGEVGSLVVGAISAGADRGGRRFPFVSFCRTAPGARAIPTALVPYTCREFLAGTAALAARAWHAERPGAHYRALAELEGCVPRHSPSRLATEEMRLLAGAPVGALWSGLSGGGHIALRRAFLAAWVDTLRAVADRPGVLAGLRLPLPDDLAQRPAVLAFWLQGLSGVGALRDDDLQIYWSAGQSAAAYASVLFQRDLAPALLAPVLDPALQVSELLDVARVVRRAWRADGPQGDAANELRAAAESEDMSLLEVLQCLRRVL